MAAPSEHRNLQILSTAGSTARVLNLRTAQDRHGGNPAFQAAPLFAHRTLNRAIYVKHRLRRGEADLFDRSSRGVVTKVVLPFDEADLRVGGRSFFVGERRYDMALREACGAWPDEDSERRDRTVLRVLDRLPSLDGFLVREALGREGIRPARQYFDVSEGDAAKMRAFIQGEIASLVRVAMQDDDKDGAQTAVFVDHILDEEAGPARDPLRLSLRLSVTDYDEGMFAWRGFLYYKWQLNAAVAQLGSVASEIKALRLLSPMPETLAAANAAREEALRSLRRYLGDAMTLVARYESAFLGLTREGAAVGFRDFLLRAPRLFMELGECVGMATHVATFWRYRFPDGPMACDALEAYDLFTDFAGPVPDAPQRR